MKKKTYSNLNESIYSKTLFNGLQVFLLPKSDFHKTYALFTTDYGSIDTSFIPINQTKPFRAPDGVAHFLEHKLFEKENYDAFDLFSNLGASSNAFTSFTKTSYLFSTIENSYQSIELLLDFVQTPYFSKASIEKEKGIIKQEIQMYLDDPNWCLFFGLLKNLYPNQPLSVDIAGSVESITNISVNDLYTCYETFYQPSNMTLFITGPFIPEEMMKYIEINQFSKKLPKPAEIKRIAPVSKQKVIQSSSYQMSVAQPKMIIGFKGNDALSHLSPENLLDYKLSLTFALQLLFSESSANYQRLYQKALIDDSFDAGFNLDRTFHFIEIYSDTNSPAKLAEILEKMIFKFQNSADWTDYHLNIIKKKTIGKTIASLNSLEYIANQFSQNLFGEKTIFDLPEVINSIDLEMVTGYFEQFLITAEKSVFTIMPENISEATND
ncbi:MULTISPECIES: pitrilysin family protein [unclassified Enterococcus]|uniref:EF-P 5-aminopentanol modification-associated protein YfmH n=1 Tax=unclassified Enterococcus TaxID=2608891 RepID=UPI0015532F94|nr:MULTISPECIES: pitrilysin family protein [unclassified Enterococcus]MBS7577892.1 insulinase family protein [Enterococcus sp. MMGLQ5-2]MBS7585247.1 insulinase family protein [Enterococcus sp. MMGLQ5-1]NPD13104.1 insulinase family protein [Enterococcus sp. MMGLQ5-1]NPD37722.1 insulinase family protein [Enterococcus sp. MMGLQ5-2]